MGGDPSECFNRGARRRDRQPGAAQGAWRRRLVAACRRFAHAARVVEVSPGAEIVHLTDQADGTGIALIEIDEVP